jgi:hypothetical protein
MPGDVRETIARYNLKWESLANVFLNFIKEKLILIYHKDLFVMGLKGKWVFATSD